MQDDLPKNFRSMEIFMNSVTTGKIRGGMQPKDYDSAIQCVSHSEVLRRIKTFYRHSYEEALKDNVNYIIFAYSCY